MNNKELYKEIIKKADTYKKEIITLKETIENLLTRLALDIKQIRGELGTEKEFLDFLATVIDEQIKLPPIAEQLDYIVIRKALDIIDKTILDRLLGKDWYEKLVSKVDTILNKVK